MYTLIPRPLHRAALRIAHRLRHYWRRIAKPHLRGVSVILRDPEGRVLFVRHAYGPPNWALPGGGIARGEMPEAAARREVAEELGVTLGEVRLLDKLEETISGTQHTAYVFVAQIKEAPQADGREIVEARFADPDNPPQPLSPVAPRRLRLLRERG